MSGTVTKYKETLDTVALRSHWELLNLSGWESLNGFLGELFVSS